MLLPLVNPDQQFCDANGVPMAGGTITTYIPGTDTLKNVWQDAEQTALQTNPIVLDAAGRCLMYGVGDFRLVLKDAAGNLIWDQETSAIDSSAFVTMDDVNAAIQVETNRALAAEGAEYTRATAAETTLQGNINTETSRATTAETSLHTAIGGQLFQSGLTVTDSAGHSRVTFPTAYSSTPVVMATIYGTIPQTLSACSAADTTGVDIYVALGGTGVSVGVTWLAYGPG